MNAAAGVTLEMGGRDIRFLPLNWASLEMLQDDLDAITNMEADPKKRKGFFKPEERNAILRVAVVSITRCNDVDEQWVKDNLDLANLPKVLEAVFNTNGFVSAASGDADGEGEQKAAGSGS